MTEGNGAVQSSGVRIDRRQTRQPVSPEVLRLVTDWVTRHWGTP